MSVAAAIAEMRNARRYSPGFLNALATADADAQNIAVPMRVSELSPGMIVDTNICASNGTLLLARGQEITESAILRLQNFVATRRLEEPVRVIVPRMRNAQVA